MIIEKEVEVLYKMKLSENQLNIIFNALSEHELILSEMIKEPSEEGYLNELEFMIYKVDKVLGG